MRKMRLLVLALALAAFPAWASLDEGLALLRAGDAAEAYAVLRKAALAGDARAARALGAMLERDVALPRGRVMVAKPDQAAGWYLKAFENGDKASADALGLLFYQGRGVPRDIAESLKWFRHNRQVDAVVKEFDNVAMADREEVAAWWLSFKTLLGREAQFPQSAARRNTWGTVEIRIDSRRRTVEVAKSDVVAELERAAVEVGESALRQLPPPKGAAEANLRVVTGFDFRLLGPGEK